MEYFGPDKELPEYPEDELLKVPETVLTTKWAHGGTTVHMKAKDTPQVLQKKSPSVEMQKGPTSAPIVAYSPIADDESEPVISWRDKIPNSPPLYREESSLGTLFSFLFFAAVIFIFIVGLATVVTGGNVQKREMTPEEQSAAAGKCTEWGGQVIYDDQGQYKDCSINGAVQ